jgi:tRNA (guanine37-N1)-methyltransferase
MKAHIISLFPEIISSYLATSIMRIAQEKWVFEPILYNLADYSVRNTRRVDRRPYGGFPGMIISPEPLYDCITQIFEKVWEKLPVYYVTPRWELWLQNTAQKFSQTEKEIILICGHYEGIDERIVTMFDIRQISIGEYVLTSGELSALVVLDSVVRLLPWVLNSESLEEESYSGKLAGKKEYPQYTRPEMFNGHSVPAELLSGDPKIINTWKQKFL